MNKMNKFESYSGFLPWFMALLLVALAAGCGGGGDGGRDPILGADGAIVAGGLCVPTGTAKAITAYSLAAVAGTINEAAKTISVAMPSGTNVTALVATFTTTGTGVTVGGVAQTSGTTANNFTSPVAYAATAVNCPTATYTVTVTVAVVVPPVAACAGTGPLPLASANNFAVLAGTALTLTNPQVITGDIGSPSITPAAGPSTLVGTQFDTASGSLPLIAAAVTDMQTAVACAVARPCDFNYVGPKDFGGSVGLAAGHHCVTGAMSVGSNLTLSNPGVYIFDASIGAGGALNSAATITVQFGGAANAANSSVFWVSSGAASGVSIGATNTFLGTILCSPCAAGAVIAANTTLLPGRTLSAAAVTLNGTNTISRPFP